MSLRSELRLLRTARDWRGRARVPRSAQRWSPVVDEDDFPTAWARTPVARVARAALQRGVLKPVAWTQTRPVVEGLEHLADLHGPAVFVANHSSHLDTPAILGSLPARITDRLAVGAAADYFFASQVTAAATTLLFNAFPIERRGSRRAPSLAGDLIDAGWSVLLYPEGGRSEDGWMTAFKLGAAQLCVSKGVPAVPIALRGTHAAMPRGTYWPRPGRPRITVRYGRPLHAAPEEGLREFRLRLVRDVARLWAEEDLGWYGALRAAADGALELPTHRRGVLPSTAAGAGHDGGTVAPWRRYWESSRPPADDGPRPVWTD